MDEAGSSLSQLLQRLLDCGMRNDFDAIRELPGAGNRGDVTRLTRGDSSVPTEFFNGLNITEQVAFLKAVAAYEDTADGVGSVTLLERLAPLKSLRHNDPRREAYAWILANTNSYWYYGGGMKSLDGFHSWRRMKFEIAQANEEIDAHRQAKDTRAVPAGSATIQTGDRGCAAAAPHGP